MFPVMRWFIHKLVDYFSKTLVALKTHFIYLVNGWVAIANVA
jgi:hypothetical protein